VSTASSVSLAHQTADAVIGARFPQPVPAAAAARVAAATRAPSGIQLSAADASAMAGRFFADELASTWELEARGGSLILHRPRAAADTLRALDRSTLRGTSITLHWMPAGVRGPAFTLDVDRVRGIEFSRISSTGAKQ